MNKKIIILIASSALLGTAVAMGALKPKKSQIPKGDSSEGGSSGEPPLVGGSASLDPCGGRNRDNSAYGLKVMVLQDRVGITGCDKDGIAGSQTNGAIKAKYPSLYATLGNVSVNNIDKYLAGKIENTGGSNYGFKANNGKTWDLGRIFDVFKTK